MQKIESRDKERRKWIIQSDNLMAALLPYQLKFKYLNEFQDFETIFQEITCD